MKGSAGRFQDLFIGVPLALALGLVACQEGARGDPSTGQDLTGTWRLVSYRLITAEGDTTYPFGETPEGQIIYTGAGDGTGEMSAHIMYPGAEPGDLSGLDATEIFARVSRTYIAYYGTYTVDAVAGTVTHHVRGSLRPTWVGTDQVRDFELLGGDRLSLTASTPRGTNFSVNFVGSNVLIWERVR